MRFLWLSFALLGACSSYRIHSVEDHGEKPVLKLETVRTSYTLFFTEVEHQYWLCQDQGEALVCHRSCGAGTDMQCPTALVGDGFATHNAR
jgi:hypothetical protein